MKKAMIPLATALAVVLVAPLAAQPPMAGPAKAGGSGAEWRLERMTERLDLSAEQQETIAALMAEQASNRDKLRADFRSQVDAVLTDAQRDKRDAYQAERIDRRLARMTARLDLSDAQQAELKTLLTETQGGGRSGHNGRMREQLASILSQEQLAKLRRPGL
ncbi:MAG: hypothetical protein C1943_13285 [Halochromatium sp.]|nr:hypothetical protein [Halochromatium sp.]